MKKIIFWFENIKKSLLKILSTRFFTIFKNQGVIFYNFCPYQLFVSYFLMILKFASF